MPFTHCMFMMKIKTNTKLPMCMASQTTGNFVVCYHSRKYRLVIRRPFLRLDVIIIFECAMILSMRMFCCNFTRNQNEARTKWTTFSVPLFKAECVVFIPNWNLFIIVQLKINEYWFWWCSGAAWASEPLSKPTMVQITDTCMPHQLDFTNNMMTSSSENIFRITGPLLGESTGDRWIPLTKVSDTEL